MTKLRRRRCISDLHPQLGGMEEDRISELLDPLICQILNHLSTKFFDSNRVSCLEKLKLTILDDNGVVDDVAYLSAWMNNAAKRKCERLVYLRLIDVTFDDAELVSFPYLKTMKLELVLFPNKAALEKLVSRCPVLEDLLIFSNEDDDKVFRVHSRSLKRLTLVQESEVVVPGVVIGAPLLCYLSIYDLATERDFDESRRNNIRSFLSAVSRVGDMSLTAETFQRIVQYSRVEPLPQFGFMSCLFASLYASAEVKIVRYFLENSAILKKLTLILSKRNSWTERYIREDLHKILRGSTKCEVPVSVHSFGE